MKRLFFWKKPGEAGQTGPGGREDVLESSGLLTGDPVQDSQSLEILLESIAEVNASIDLDRVLEDICGRSIMVTKAERAILLLGQTVDELGVRVARDKDGADLGRDVVYSQTLVHRCLEDGHAERSVVQSDQEALELGQSVYNLKLRAVMCAPLRARERTIGVIYVDSTAVRREFSSRDLALFGALSAQLAIAVENARLYQDSLQKARLEQDFEIARRIQHHLLAPVPEDYSGAELAVRFNARDEASGDTYDFMPLPDGRLVTLIGDVTGHGIGAALLTHAAQAAVRSYFELVDDLSEVATRLNNRLVASVEAGNFMSMIMLLVDPNERALHYVNGGHPSLLIVRDGDVMQFEKTGMVFGVVGDQRYASAGPIELHGGDLIFLHTDGVDETMNTARELYGTERLKSTLAAGQGCSADELLSLVEQDVLDFAGGVEQDDDLTMLAIRIR